MQLALCLPMFSKEDLQDGELWGRARPPCQVQSCSAFISSSLKEMQERKQNGECEGSHLAVRKTWHNKDGGQCYRSTNTQPSHHQPLVLQWCELQRGVRQPHWQARTRTFPWELAEGKATAAGARGTAVIQPQGDKGLEENLGMRGERKG